MKGGLSVDVVPMGGKGVLHQKCLKNVDCGGKHLDCLVGILNFP